jgi:hypothetical protein
LSFAEHAAAACRELRKARDGLESLDFDPGESLAALEEFAAGVTDLAALLPRLNLEVLARARGRPAAFRGFLEECFNTQSLHTLVAKLVVEPDHPGTAGNIREFAALLEDIGIGERDVAAWSADCAREEEILADKKPRVASFKSFMESYPSAPGDEVSRKYARMAAEVAQLESHVRVCRALQMMCSRLLLHENIDVAYLRLLADRLDEIAERKRRLDSDAAAQEILGSLFRGWETAPEQFVSELQALNKLEDHERFSAQLVGVLETARVDRALSLLQRVGEAERRVVEYLAPLVQLCGAGLIDFVDALSPEEKYRYFQEMARDGDGLLRQLGLTGEAPLRLVAARPGPVADRQSPGETRSSAPVPAALPAPVAAPEPENDPWHARVREAISSGIRAAPLVVVPGGADDRRESFDEFVAGCGETLSGRRFYEYDYVTGELRAFVRRFIDAFGPVTVSGLSRVVAGVHGFRNRDKQIRHLVRVAVARERRNSESPDGELVFWPEGETPAPIVAFRGLNVNGHIREWREIPHPERLGLAVEEARAFPEGDAAALARRMAVRAGLGHPEPHVADALRLLAEEAKLVLFDGS